MTFCCIYFPVVQRQAMITLRLIYLLILLMPLISSFDLTILHTNDVHSRLEQFDSGTVRCNQESANAGECFGGVARIQTVVKQTREDVENVLFLDGGDQFQGTSWFQFYEGDAAAHFMNLLEYDAMVSQLNSYNPLTSLSPSCMGRFSLKLKIVEVSKQWVVTQIVGWQSSYLFLSNNFAVQNACIKINWFLTKTGVALIPTENLIYRFC